MQNFSSLALKLREEIEDDGRTYCKNAKFQTAPYEIKILLLIFAREGKTHVFWSKSFILISFCRSCSGTRRRGGGSDEEDVAKTIITIGPGKPTRIREHSPSKKSPTTELPPHTFEQAMVRQSYINVGA